MHALRGTADARIDSNEVAEEVNKIALAMAAEIEAVVAVDDDANRKWWATLTLTKDLLFDSTLSVC